MQEAICQDRKRHKPQAAWRRHWLRVFRPRAGHGAADSLPRHAASRLAATDCARRAGRKLSLIAPPYCERWGIPFAYDLRPGVLSMQAITDPPAYHRARAAVRYTISRGRWYMRRNTAMTGSTLQPTMGAWMARAGRELLADAEALVPEPLHWRRLWARRFNQSALLAKAIAQVNRRSH